LLWLAVDVDVDVAVDIIGVVAGCCWLPAALAAKV